MKILITGGAGFIGSHLCDKYTRDGHTVICFDNFTSGSVTNIRHLFAYRNFKLIQGDVRDAEAVEKVMRDVDAVLHLAAQIHVDRSYIEPRLTWEVNVLGTQNILEAVRSNDTPKMLFASTSEIYGSAQYIPVDEKHPLNAPHPYGASKIAADRMCHAYVQTFGLNVRILRFFNVFGPRQKDAGYGGVIPIFIRRVLSNVPPIVYGNGLQTRDFLFIRDAIRAYDLVLNHKESILEPINFGTGKEVTILELAWLVIEACGKKGHLEPVHAPPRIAELQKLIADAKLARKLLGWAPECDFKTGIKESVDWYRNYGMEERMKFE